jgi:hypothetical protein
MGAAAFAPRALLAQAKPPILIGWLNTDSREASAQHLAAFKERCWRWVGRSAPSFH